MSYQNQNPDNQLTETSSDSSKQFSPYISDRKEVKRTPILQFKSSITVLPSVVTEASLSTFDDCSESFDFKNSFGREPTMSSYSKDIKMEAHYIQNEDSVESNQIYSITTEPMNKQTCQDPKESDNSCQPDCSCTKCTNQGPTCGDQGCTKELCDDSCDDSKQKEKDEKLPEWAWQCRKNFCHKVFRPSTFVGHYTSFSRCTLLCMGPQLWPYPIGYTHFSKTIVSVSTKNLEYKFQSVPSDSVHLYLAEAFKLFIKDLARLEKLQNKPTNLSKDTVKKMVILIDVESDTDPRLRINTDEGYMLKIETKNNQVIIKVSGLSFCGARHGFETLSQLILLDQSTGYLIMLSSAIIKDAPTYKYRGLMVDTGRNYIPVVDLLRTVDAMATCKLNTFHWRISDATSFPLNLSKVPEFEEYGPYDRSMVYTKKDIRMIVNRAGVRGIRVLIEVAAPGPVGRPFSWLSSTTCSRKNNSLSCDNDLCRRLTMHDSTFDVLQKIYSEILEMTNVDDVFHLSDSVFSMTNCYYLFDDREGFLDKALFRLKMANKGFLPQLPIIWYTSHLMKHFEANTWERLGVQIDEWDTNPYQSYLNKFRVIHSTKWDLSCEMRKQRCTRYRTWQQMYSWKSWRNVDVFTTEGGESILWTDLVDSSNLDYHLWPRAAVVAERLWSDVVANGSANKHVYMRLDTHRWRMLQRGIQVQPIWPPWCSFSPSSCLEKVH
ncbi:unnamed protein product [Danaus chrysippus]|uniref:beta-N-acetylhexosaminidase n=1 Tax=Danaus chrysippus TaxID=151541 RepID=A0A8J2QX96_9NEOP|nr:unnamed protein product [Danaus chrysippus]